MNYRESKLVPILAYLYLILPITIFCIGWLKWYFALLFCLVLLPTCFFLYKKINKVALPLPNTKKEWILTFVSILFIFLLIYISGIANNSAQTYDLYWRNTIFTELIVEPWPTSMTNDGQTIYLVYYIGFFLPAALFGKVFGISAGFAMLGLWSFLGIALVWLMFCSYFKKITLWPLLVFVFFGAIGFLFSYISLPSKSINFFESGQYINAYFHQREWIYLNEETSPLYCLPGNIMEIFWTFNQGIPMFVGMGLIFLIKEKYNCIFITSLLVLSSTLACFGMAVIIISLVFVEEDKDTLSYKLASRESILKNLKAIVLNPTVPLAIVITAFTGLYAVSNSNINNDAPLLSLVNPFTDIDMFFRFIIFELLCVVIYFAYCFKHEKKNPLFYIASITIMIFVDVRMYGVVDFMLKAPTPLLVYLSFIFIHGLNKDYQSKSKNRLAMGILLVLLSSISGIIEILRLGCNSIQIYKTGEVYSSFVTTIIGMLVFITLAFILLVQKNLPFNKKVIPLIKSCGVCLCAVLVIVLMIYIIDTGSGLSCWNRSALPWEEIYCAPNFSGNKDSFFFSHLSKTY